MLFEQEDLVGDIQSSIGYTSAGFPFASREQIECWIHEPEQIAFYPEWLIDSDERIDFEDFPF